MVRITKRNGSLSKHIALNAEGKLHIDSSACAMCRGTAQSITITTGMAGLATLYAGLDHNEAVVHSNADLGPEPREICTKDDYKEERKRNPNIICRSKQFLVTSCDSA